MSSAPWLLPAILAAVLWGVSVFTPKLAIRRLPPYHMVVYSYGAFLVGAILLQGFYGFHIDYDPKSVLLSLAIGAIGGISQMLFTKSLSVNTLTYSVVITSLYPAVATFLAFIILHEALTLRQAAGIALGICSLILTVKTRDRKTQR